MARNGKVGIYIVERVKGGQDDGQADSSGGGKRKPRLLKGTRKAVEDLLIAEYSIEPCSVEDAHQLADVVIEEAAQE